ncbi:hypothetical protein [Aeromonas sp. NJAU223]|uniref:hypothetical protein n=1 Tax=Aeromonas sp. NJAU223 TaxID=3115650 RepID=UPI003DA89F62
MKIYEVPSERRYWVVRADSGRFYDHFCTHGVIALAHLNQLFIEDQKNFFPNQVDLFERVVKFNTDKVKKRTISSHLAQIRSFIYDIKIGDWVLTVGDRGVRYGRVIGNPYISKEKLRVIYDHETQRYSDMDMHLRRNVQWGPVIHREKLPYGLIRALKANQTVFNLDKNWDALYHSIYPAFTCEDRLYLSLKITSKDEIKNYSVTSLFNILNDVEVIGKEISRHGDVDTAYLDNVLADYVENDELTITTKAQFHSPGDIWNVISGGLGNLDNWMTYIVVAYSMLFGNQKLGFDGFIDLQTRQKIWDIVLERMKSKHAQKSLESLKIQLPDADTSKLEDNSNDQQ